MNMFEEMQWKLISFELFSKKKKLKEIKNKLEVRRFCLSIVITKNLKCIRCNAYCIAVYFVLD